MQEKYILEKLEVILKRIIDVENISIHRNYFFGNQIGKENLGLTSIEFVLFIVAVEEEFGIIIDYEIQLVTVGDLIDIITKQ